jgi:hypothetical protein
VGEDFGESVGQATGEQVGLGDGGCVEVGPDAAGVSVGYEHDHRRAAGQWREGVYAFDAGARQVTPGGGALPPAIQREATGRRSTVRRFARLAVSRSLWERCSFRPQRRSPCLDLAAPASWAHRGGTGATS